MKAGRLEACRDPEWWKVGMLPQGNITVDRGREGKLDLELVANRLMSLQESFAKEGKDWLTEIEQMSEEASRLSELGLAVADVAKRGSRIVVREDDGQQTPDADEPASNPD